jgi:hypothetical protein
LIPLRDTVPSRHRPVVTLALIAIKVAVFVVELAAPRQHLPTTRGRVSRSGCWRSGGSIPGRARRPTPGLWALPGGADAERLHRQHHAV